MEYLLAISGRGRIAGLKKRRSLNLKSDLEGGSPARAGLSFCAIINKVTTEPISHPFFHIEVEGLNTPDQIYLIKILSIDGRRFTYELRAALSEEAVEYVKTLLDAVVFNDLIIEWTGDGFEARETRENLKKHS